MRAPLTRWQQAQVARILALALLPLLPGMGHCREGLADRSFPAIESDRIPMTNNTTELVIRRFAQHYQNFCGFDRIETAQTYLAVFEWCYRFTPFTQDAQKRIRGMCPLELAGYDVSTVPMAQICRGQVLDWPPEGFGEVVPRG